jgi:hypothetical protein
MSPRRQLSYIKRQARNLPGGIQAWTAAARIAQQLADEFAQWLERPDPSQVGAI